MLGVGVGGVDCDGALAESVHVLLLALVGGGEALGLDKAAAVGQLAADPDANHGFGKPAVVEEVFCDM